MPARSLCLLWVPSLPGSGTPGRVCLPPPVLLQGSSCRVAQWSEARLALFSLALSSEVDRLRVLGSQAACCPREVGERRLPSLPGWPWAWELCCI